MASMPAPSSPDRTRVVLAVLLAVAFVSLAGCRRDSAGAMIAANNDTNAKRLGTLYGFFQLRNELRGPRDEAEFRAFIAAQDPGRLALAGVSPARLDDLFRGERDRLPFKIRYGVDTRVRGPALPVVFEQVGRDGRRQVGFTGGGVEEVDAARAEILWTGASEKTSPEAPGRDRGW